VVHPHAVETLGRLRDRVIHPLEYGPQELTDVRLVLNDQRGDLPTSHWVATLLGDHNRPGVPSTPAVGHQTSSRANRLPVGKGLTDPHGDEALDEIFRQR